MIFRKVYKYGLTFLPFCHNPRVWRTDGQTEFSSLDRVCIPCSAIKIGHSMSALAGYLAIRSNSAACIASLLTNPQKVEMVECGLQRSTLATVEHRYIYRCCRDDLLKTSLLLHSCVRFSRRMPTMAVTISPLRNASTLQTSVHRVTVKSSANNRLWSWCRRHFVGQLNRRSTQFSESRKNTCRCLTTYICQYFAVDQSANYYLPITVGFNFPYNMAATDRVDFNDVIAHPNVSSDECWCALPKTSIGTEGNPEWIVSRFPVDRWCQTNAQWQWEICDHVATGIVNLELLFLAGCGASLLSLLLVCICTVVWCICMHL